MNRPKKSKLVKSRGQFKSSIMLTALAGEKGYECLDGLTRFTRKMENFPNSRISVPARVYKRTFRGFGVSWKNVMRAGRV